MRAGQKLGTLTDRQKSILSFIRDYINEHQYAPTTREIGKHFDISSPNGVSRHLRSMEAKGYLTRKPHAARALAPLGRPAPSGALVLKCPHCGGSLN
jgi:repressor LexA